MQNIEKQVCTTTIIQLEDLFLNTPTFGDPTILLFPTHPFTPTMPS